MRTVFSEQHRLRAATTELSGGKLIPPFESPERADRILAEVEARSLGPIVCPRPGERSLIERIHEPRYLAFLRSCWSEWVAAGHEGEAIATIWPSRRFPRRDVPRDIEGQLGHYALAAETSIDEGTWAAAWAAAEVAMTGAHLVDGKETSAFALCRPPGHHAASDMFGGYCFLNNAALAAEVFLGRGAKRVAILDIDFHHGNGTQDIFYDRSDVFYASLHGDPDEHFPYFSGGKDEVGKGQGEGFNANYPMPSGTPHFEWLRVLELALVRLKAFRPDAVVVSLGVDTYEMDPLGAFQLSSSHFLEVGERIAGLTRPTLFVMEGGYALPQIGLNTVNVLEGYEQG